MGDLIRRNVCPKCGGTNLELDCLYQYGKIIDMRVNEDDNTEYMVVFDDGTWDSFLGYELRGDGLYVL